MAWTHLDSATLDSGILDLYASDDGVYMIRVNGLELMNGRCIQSEKVLGELASLLTRDYNPRILLGGLGLGHTLASLTRTLGNSGAIAVAEISADVIRWFEQYFKATLFSIDPSNVCILNADVSSIIGAQSGYDAIVLDVDNGPEPLSARCNAFLYSEEGLRATWRCLNDAGILFVWSGFESADFVVLAEKIGYSVACLPVAVAGRDDFFHYIYVLSKHPFERVEPGAVSLMRTGLQRA